MDCKSVVAGMHVRRQVALKFLVQSDFMIEMGEVCLLGLDSVYNAERFLHRQVREMLPIAQSINDEHIKIM